MIATKSEALFQRLLEINRLCFTGVELPPEKRFQYDYDLGTVFTVSVGEVIVGYALVLYYMHRLFIVEIAVVPQYQRRGFGTKLLREIFEGEHDPIDLTVKVDNPAQKLYFDEGFRVVNFIRNYYGQSAGLRMRRG